MEPIGHLGMALLFAAGAWTVLDARTSLTFTAAVAAGGLAPDLDVYLKHVVPIAHHGLTHTLTFAVGVAALYVGGGLALAAVRGTDRRRAATLGAVAGVLGVSAHLTADLLTTPDVAPPLKPLLPFSSSPVVVDVVYVYSDLWNVGLFVAGVLAHLVVGVATTGVGPLRRRLGEVSGE
jgi:membrane-bound metal-dependent hydrolase YbcI (DUF457 family)